MSAGDYNLITVLGHTAAGKTAFAANLAQHLGTEIISADSRQVYRGMDIGTGKDYEDYRVGDQVVKAHLIDLLEAGQEYNLYLFKRDFYEVFKDISGRGLLPILCGGTGLYVEAVLRNYQLLNVPVDEKLRLDLEKKSYPELEAMLKLYGPLHNVTDTVNRKRLIRAIEIAMHQSALPDEQPETEQIITLNLGIYYARMNRRKRITQRLEQRLKQGLVEEVEGLLERGLSMEKLDYYGLEYRYLGRYLAGILSYEDMFEKLNTAIHQYAKRQMTYFRGMERRGIRIHWIEGELPLEKKMGKALALIG